MGRTLATWDDRVRVVAGSPTAVQLADESISDHVRAALREFSGDRPRIAYTDYPGNGSTYALAVSSLTGWVDGFSGVEAVEYPLGERIPIYLDDQSWIPYPSQQSPSEIRLLVDTPATGKTARVFYRVPWPAPTTDPTVDKVGDVDYEPVVCNAAARCVLQLGARDAGNTSPTIPAADAVDWGGDTERYRSLYRDLLKTYADHVGGAAAGPASGQIDWDARSAYPDSTAYLFRGRR